MRIVIAVPVLNEELVLRKTVASVAAFASARLVGHHVTIVIADNGSTDRTAEIAVDLVTEQTKAGKSVPRVEYVRLDKRGKGAAIREAWQRYPAEAYAFMDADLATDLSALPASIKLIEDGAGMAIGSRYHPDSKVSRSAWRQLVSLGYRTLLGLAIPTEVVDAPCGFKVVSAAIVTNVLPTVRDDRWFFDTELVLRAERMGYCIAQVPVIWRDLQPAGRESKVHVLSLATEYAASVSRLRRELGSPTGKKFFSGSAPTAISRREWFGVLTLAAFIVAFTAVPPVVGLLAARVHGLEWTGRQFLSPGDLGVYLSYIDQAAHGKIFLDNMFTQESTVPVLNIIWLFVGWIARAFGISALAAYHLARTLLIFPFAAVSFVFIAYLLRQMRQRFATFALFMLGSGLGAYAMPFLKFTMPTSNGYEWPIDLWMGESNAFLSMLYSPHFVASWTLLLLSLLLLLMAYDRNQMKYGAYAGLAALALFQFHPYYVPSLFAVGGISLFIRTRSEGYRPRQWGAYAIFLVISSPAVAYHYWLSHYTVNSVFMLTNNIMVTPSPPFVFLGFGLISILAILGWIVDRNAKPADRVFAPLHLSYLAAWAVTLFMLSYVPFTFQRRLIEGLQFPLLLLSMPALIAIVKAAKRNVPKSEHATFAVIGIFAAAAFFLTSTASALLRSVEGPLTDGRVLAVEKHETPYFFSPDESAALQWLRQETPADTVVLSDMVAGNAIAGWAMRRVYAGHWANTLDLERKTKEIALFFGTKVSSQDRKNLVAMAGASYVWFGPVERSYGGNFSADPAFERAFSSGDVALYRLRP